MSKFQPPKFESAKAAVWRELEIIRRCALRIGGNAMPCEEGQCELHGLTACVKEKEAEIERLRNLAADLMDLADELPIKHPQQETRRKILRGQCEMFGVYQQTLPQEEHK